MLFLASIIYVFFAIDACVSDVTSAYVCRSCLCCFVHAAFKRELCVGNRIIELSYDILDACVCLIILSVKPY